MGIFQNKTSRALILIMGALVLTGILIARTYYSKVNTSVDPRVADARKMYEKYNVYAQTNQFDSIFVLLDTIESVYSSIAHYQQSYEIGVLYNNRAATYLTLALYSPVFNQGGETQDSLINLSELASLNAIKLYTNWLERYANLNEREIAPTIRSEFVQGLSTANDEQQAELLEKRTREIQDAQIETPRRLSVSYTNLGIVYRHREHYEKAAESYQKALDLWDQNLTAKNNLNILLGRPIEKRSFLKKLFPPERK